MFDILDRQADGKVDLPKAGGIGGQADVHSLAGKCPLFVIVT